MTLILGRKEYFVREVDRVVSVHKESPESERGLGRNGYNYVGDQVPTQNLNDM